MDTPPQVNATVLLEPASRGEPKAAGRLMQLVYDELRLRAAAYLGRERRDHTLQPTALVHEAFLRLVDQTAVDWRGRTHFFAIASEMIRRILVDHARKRGAIKRGGEFARVTFGDGPAAQNDESVDLLALDQALQELHGLSERQARVVELRFFGGLTVEDTASVLSVSERTVKGDWRVAQAWLRRRLAE